MLKLNFNKNVNLNDADEKIIKAFEQMFRLYPEDGLVATWKDIQAAEFNNHYAGKGGNHIWVKRKSDDTQIFIITRSAAIVK